MTNKLYRTLLGTLLLISLYIDNITIIYFTASIILLEVVTNWRIPKIINRIRKLPEPDFYLQNSRFNFEAERAFRLFVGVLIITTSHISEESILWFIPWFIAFIILGAGISGLCPVMALMTRIGFK